MCYTRSALKRKNLSPVIPPSSSSLGIGISTEPLCSTCEAPAMSQGNHVSTPGGGAGEQTVKFNCEIPNTLRLVDPK